jgi:glyceraldehyde-3-phosphate dehydrogenase (NADP+)
MADHQVIDKVQNIFPRSLEDVPENARFPQLDPKLLSSYVFEGQLIEWTGAKQKIQSVVCLPNKEGKPQRVVLGEIHLIDEVTAMKLLDSSVKAYDHGRGHWPTATVSERIECTTRFVEEMVKQREDVVRMLMWEIGKNRSESENEFDRTVIYLNETIKAVRDRNNIDAKFLTAEGHVAQVRRSPIGVFLSLGPFNYPLNETFTTLIPAIIMGNTGCVKLPRFGCMSLIPLFNAFAKCFPPGVVNVFNGRGSDTASPMIRSGKLNAFAFIGSSSVANKLRIEHPKPSRLRCILGLDAKNAGVILDDADLESTVKECITGSLTFAGQRCTAIKILFVQRGIADRFIQKFAETVDKLQVGMPWEKVSVCPLPEVDKPKSMEDLVQDAISKGAQVVNKNGGLTNGTFYFPSVVYPVNRDMKLYTIEQFGPVVPIVPFDHTDEVLTYLSESTYGQQVSLFGQNAAVIGPLCDILVNEVCRVNLNGACKRGPDVWPFTARKDSAEGTLDIESAIRAFSIRTMVAGPINQRNRSLIQEIITTRSSQFLNNDILF